MSARHDRRHIAHFEVAGGTAHIIWRLHRRQCPMSGEARSEVLEVIRNDDGVRCRVDAAVVMDDHVHVLATFAHRVPSAKLVHGWKSISSHRLCKLARSAPLWQAEYYLRWLADPVAVAACTAYIRANPARRWPGVVSYPWLLP